MILIQEVFFWKPLDEERTVQYLQNPYTCVCGAARVDVDIGKQQKRNFRHLLFFKDSRSNAVYALSVFPALPILVPLASVRHLGSTENRMKETSVPRLGEKVRYEIKCVDRVLDVTMKDSEFVSLR